MQIIIIEDLERFITQNGVFAAAFAFAAALFCSIIYRILYRKSIGAGKSTGIFFFAAYCFMVAAIALFTREPGTRTRVDLIPFSTFYNNPRSMAYIVENILMLIPLGIFLPMLMKVFRKGSRCLLAGFLCSALIECTQFITQRGFFQTDDIMTNVLGTGIGYLIFLAGYRLRNLVLRK